MLRRHDHHPSRNRCEGGRLHHLPLPQWGLVEAGAVRPAGVPQRPDAVLDGLRRGRWRKSSAEAPSATALRTTERTGAQFLSKPRQTTRRTLERRTLDVSHGCTCTPGATACFQTLPDLLYTLPWTPSCNHNSSPIFLYVRLSSACPVHQANCKHTYWHFVFPRRLPLRACLHDVHNGIHVYVLLLSLRQEFRSYELRSNPKTTRLSTNAAVLGVC